MFFSSHEEADHFDYEELEGGGRGGRRESSAYRGQSRSGRGLTRAQSVEEESPRMPKRGGASASASASRHARPMRLDYYATMDAGRRVASRRSRSDPPVDDEFTPRHRSHGYGYTVFE